MKRRLWLNISHLRIGRRFGGNFVFELSEFESEFLTGCFSSVVYGNDGLDDISYLRVYT